MINRGGEKVSPAEVDREALRHEQVIDAATFPIPHPTMGEEVAIAVALKPDSKLTEKELVSFLLTRLAGFKVPREIVFVDEIPRGDGGKVQRYKLGETLGVAFDRQASSPRKSYRKPTPMEFRLQQIWQSVLGLPYVGFDENFFLLGGDSLQAVELFLQIEKELKCRLPVAALFEAGTVAEMANLIEVEKPQGCVVPVQPEGSRPPFFCVHGASGQVIGFYNLAKRLGADQPFFGIQAIGWDQTAPPYTTSVDMAAHYVAEMRRIQPDGPYFLGGYSFGGRIAVYMANILREAGEEVALLAIIDTTCLAGRQYVPFGEWLERIEAPPGPRCVGLALRYAWFRVRKAYDALYSQARRLVLFPIREWYRASERKVPLFMCRPDRLNILVRLEHRNMPRYDGDAVFFRTEIPAGSMSHSDNKDAWKQVIGGNLEVVPLPLSHAEVIQEPGVSLLATELGRRIPDAMPAPARRKAAVGT